MVERHLLGFPTFALADPHPTSLLDQLEHASRIDASSLRVIHRRMYSSLQA